MTIVMLVIHPVNYRFMFATDARITFGWVIVIAFLAFPFALVFCFVTHIILFFLTIFLRQAVIVCVDLC